MRASRLVSILMLLQTRGRLSARTLAEHLEVSPRTVYRDIDELSAAGVPVIVERGATGGFELVEGYRTTLTGLTAGESQSLFFLGLPEPITQLGLGDTLASAQLKLLAALPREQRAEAHRVGSRFFIDLTGWYRRAAPAPHLRTLADAVWSERQLTIRYDGWRGETRHELDPLGLVIKAGDWYLIAAPHARHGDASPRTFRVSNVRAVTVGSSFSRPKGFELSAHWAESTRRFERELYRGTADLRVNARGQRLLRAGHAAVTDAVDRAANGGQRNLDAAGWLLVTIPIESIAHAAGELLELGTDVEVLAPRALRDRLRDTARQVARMYASPGRRRPHRA